MVEQADDAADSAADADAEAPALEAPVVVSSETPNPLSSVSLKRPSANNSTIRDTVCLVIGCLLAYQMGKGSEARPAAEEGEAAEGEAPADPGDAPGGEGDSDAEGE